MNDYIFCPFCGATKWVTDKTQATAKGKLTFHRCSSCKKFSYTNITTLIDHPILVGITQTTRYSVEAEISHYKILVSYYKDETEFEDTDKREVILTVNSAVQFNWYKNEELISKIKKYILFS